MYIKKVLNQIFAGALSVVICFGTLTSVSVAEETLASIPEPIKVIDFSYSFDELAAQDEQFEVVDNFAKPELVEDEEMGQVLKLGKTIPAGERLENSKYNNTDEDMNSTIVISNPYSGMEELNEYEPYEDVKSTIYSHYLQPEWEKGITISYWLKVPEEVSSNILNFTSERFLMQQYDYAKHLSTVKFDIEYNAYTDEEKEALGIGPSGVTENSLFYYDVLDETYEEKPVYDIETIGIAYRYNKFYETGYLKHYDGTYSLALDMDYYSKYSEAPYLGSAQNDHDPGNSIIRYGWAHGELLFDTTSSFYFESDCYKNVQLNPNNVETYGEEITLEDRNLFAIHSWKNVGIFEPSMEAGVAAPSPASQPNQWHNVALIIQNDWVEFYLDGVKVNVKENYAKNGWADFIGCGFENEWNSFNKGTGSRYNYGVGTRRDDNFNITNGLYVSTTIMEFLTNTNTVLSIGGGSEGVDNHFEYISKNTDEILLKNVVFYDKMLNPEQIEYLAQNPDIFTKTYEVGDVNKDGAINATDALIVLRHVAKIEELVEDQLALADAEADEKINAEDALEILKYAAGLRDGFGYVNGAEVR